MELISRWPQLEELARAARTFPGLELWLFGSALRREDPRDLDVLLVYEDRRSVVWLRELQPWSDFWPPCDIIAMTHLEVAEYSFIETTKAIRII